MIRNAQIAIEETSNKEERPGHWEIDTRKEVSGPEFAGNVKPILAQFSPHCHTYASIYESSHIFGSIPLEAGWISNNNIPP